MTSLMLRNRAVHRGGIVAFLSNSHEGGTNGSLITVGNSGGASGSPFDTVNNGTQITYDNTHVAHGSLAAKFAGGELWWKGTALRGTQATMWGRTYFYYSGSIASSDAPFAFFLSNATTLLCQVKISNTDGRFYLTQSGTPLAGSTSAAGLIVPGRWYRMEMSIDTVAGSASASLYLGDSATAVATVSGSAPALSAGPVGAVRVAYDVLAWSDDTAMSTTGALGPYIPVGATTPAAPTSPAATPGTSQNVVSWTAPTSTGDSPLTGYAIYRATSSGAETLLTTVTADVTSYTDNAVTNGTTYYYKVAAQNAIGTGTQSSEVSGTPTAPPAGPILVSHGTAVIDTNTIPAPANIVTQNLLLGIAYMQTSSTTPTYTIPSGFTNGGTYPSGNGGAGFWVVFYKYAVAGDVGVANYTFTTTGHRAVHILQYSNVAASSPIDVLVGAIIGNGTTWNAPSVTTTLANDLLLCAIATFNGNALSTVPAGMSARGSARTAGVTSYYDADVIVASAGATGTKGFTMATADSGGAISVAIKSA